MIEQPFENGTYRTLEQDVNSFFMDFDLADIDCKVRVISRKFLKKYPDYIPRDKDHGIYILVKNNTPVYVGQSKNFNSRVNQHNINNKACFDRCFIFFKPQKDLRGLLDYMESYTIYSIEERGLILNNVLRPNPDEDVLIKSKKILARKWIEAFISFLPCFGVDISEHEDEDEDDDFIVRRKKLPRSKININVNNIDICGENNIIKTINFIKYIGINKLEPYLNELNSHSLSFRVEKYDFSNELFNDRKIHSSRDEYGQEFFLYSSISTDHLVEKLKYLSTKLNLKNINIFKESVIDN